MGIESIQAFRTAFPEYDSYSDNEVVSNLQKYNYPDMTREDVAGRLGIRIEPLALPEAPIETRQAIPGTEPLPGVQAPVIEDPRGTMPLETMPQQRSMVEIVRDAVGPLMGTMYPQAPSTNVGEIPDQAAAGQIVRGVAERVPESAKSIGGSSMQAAGELRNIIPGYFGMNPVPGASPIAVGEAQAAADPMAVKGEAMYQKARQRMEVLREEATQGDFGKQ
jgi:hypothetical protein